jgi:hypothetical protein
MQGHVFSLPAGDKMCHESFVALKTLFVYGIFRLVSLAGQMDLFPFWVISLLNMCIYFQIDLS